MADFVTRLPNVNYPYTKIIFGALMDNPFPVTNEPDTDGRPKYFTSLSHKIVTRQAAQMEIDVSFVPNMSYDVIDADSFEMAIVSRMGLCTVEYGWSVSDTVTYWVMLTDYSITFSNGVINYHFSGISQAVIFNSKFVNFIYPNEKNKGYGATNFLKYVKEFIETNSQTSQGNDSRATYTLDINGCTKSFRPPTADNPIKVEKYSLIATLQEVVSQLEVTSDKKTDFLALVVDDRFVSNDEPKKIRIVKCSTEDTANYAMTFKWNDPNGDVLDFSVQYQGTTALARLWAEASSTEAQEKVEDELTSSILDANGKPRKINTTGFLDAVGNKLLMANIAQVDYTEQMSKNYWVQKANYPYKATLTVLGNLNPNIEVASVIHLDVLLGTSKHHTSGNYMILGWTDSVSGKGFTTTYELLKLQTADDPFAPKTMPRNKRNIINKALDEEHYEYGV